MDRERPGVSVSTAARHLGICDDTCRSWFDAGLLSGYRTAAGYRRIDLGPPVEEHVAVSVAARALHLSPATVRARFDEGRLAGFRLASGQRRIARSSIERLAR